MKRKPRTDIPDWRDPNMPVTLQKTDSFGRIFTVSVTPEYATYIFATRFELIGVPDWRNDPTYNLRKRK